MKRIKQWAALVLIGLALFSWPDSVRADNMTTPQLEEQVLQIIRAHPEVILESVQSYQKQQQDEQRKIQQSFIQNLQRNPKAVIGKSPTKGAKQGKAVLVEFSDFQCPYCASASKTLREFMAKHSSEVTLTYKNFPLTGIHDQALPAAKAAWAAGEQGKFWEFHDALFDGQKRMGEAFYLETAKRLGLDVDRFNRDRTSQAAAAAIATDVDLAEKLGIEGTPFFVMNGRTFSGAVELSDLEATLISTK
ncbi:MAG: thioredoxin domain-containing protein [Myxacorys californica WJT36-NPBG1]|nr:thioredoxin domain-containing protein [Myxacorys californica WJT36-NPBG1]